MTLCETNTLRRGTRDPRRPEGPQPRPRGPAGPQPDPGLPQPPGRRALTYWRILGGLARPSAALRASFRRPAGVWLSRRSASRRPDLGAGSARGGGGEGRGVAALPPQRQAGRRLQPKPDSRWRRRRRAQPPPRPLPPAGWGQRAPAGSGDPRGGRADQARVPLQRQTPVPAPPASPGHRPLRPPSC